MSLPAPREPEIRLALSRRLNAASAGVVINEYTVVRGANRVDVAVLGANQLTELWGFEIKSDVDTLKRLPEQVKSFNKVFQRMTLVTGPSHLPAALALIPDWWGVLVVVRDEAGVAQLHELRPAAFNPKPNYRWICRLLWREELVEVLRGLGRARGTSRMTRAKLSERLRASVPEPKLIPLIVQAIFRREEWLKERGA